MNASKTNPYLRTKVMTASPAELRLMLLDGAIKFLDQGKSGLEEKDYEKSYFGLSRCQAILMELINSLRPEQDPEMCSRLSGLYTFMYLRLVKASTERDPRLADEVLDLLRYERETWAQLMAKLAAENGGVPETNGAAPESSDGAPEASDGTVAGAAPGSPSLSIRG